ncbi:MAG: Crp/Fnr family transcriptional regulator [Phenylobacterium sp.]|nr:Crp/Fnr family transcriptional regulator [Phenylobacterium sp.]
MATLQTYAALSAHERVAVQAIVGAPRPVGAEGEIVGEGEFSADCHVLLEGQAFRHKTLADGRRQILGFLVPGDVVDLQRLYLGVDYGVTALTPCQVATAPRAKLEDLLLQHSGLARAFWSLVLIEASIQRAWMLGMGRRTARARVAHLLCEVFLRLREAGLARGNRCGFPITQNHLADALGLSGVHTNRVLQALRSEGLIALRARELVILDWPGLEEAAEFDPAYLYLHLPFAENPATPPIAIP